MYHIKKHFFKAVLIASLSVLPLIALDSMTAVNNHSDSSLVADRAGSGWGGKGGAGNGFSGRKATNNWGGYDRNYDRGSYDRDYNRGDDYNRGYNGGGVYFNVNPNVNPYYYNQTPNGMYNYDSGQ